MRAIFKESWWMLDHSKPIEACNTDVEPGTYELEKIPNPHGHKAPWLVISGTTIGATVGYWREWSQEVSADNPIVLEE